MEFVRRIYGLSADGDKTVRYIGQTENLTRRFLQHTSFQDPCVTCKVAWLVHCKYYNLAVRVRTLEVVSADSDKACKKLALRQESAWIKSATRRGIRLVNGQMWLSGIEPQCIAKCWLRFQINVARAYLRQRESGEHENVWQDSHLIKEIERDFPQLKLIRYRYKRMWQVPACI